jgi:hypothetical protein
MLLISSFTSLTGLSWTIVGEIPTIDFTLFDFLLCENGVLIRKGCKYKLSL